MGERCEPKPGADPCAAGLFCFSGHVDNPIGICLALCDPDAPEEWCNDTYGYTLAYCDSWNAPAHCEADCSPFSPDCPPNLHCSLIGDRNWECMTGGTAVDGDACAHSVECGPQLACVNGDFLGDCNDVACCSELCDSSYGGGPECSNPEESCNWYCFGDGVPGQPRCQCIDDWDCSRGLCIVWN